MSKGRVKVKMAPAKLLGREKAGNITSLGRAGAYIRGIARKSIKVSKDYSKPGSPPHSRRGQLKNAIVYFVEPSKQSAVIGPTFEEIGLIGRRHEFGGILPPRKRRKGDPDFRVGGWGPISYSLGGRGKSGRFTAGGVRFAKLRTDRQVQASLELAQNLPFKLGGVSQQKRKYPPRPFMSRALRIARKRLPKFWANSVRGG